MIACRLIKQGFSKIAQPSKIKFYNKHHQKHTLLLWELGATQKKWLNKLYRNIMTCFLMA